MTPVWKNPVHLAAFGFGAGLAPWAPGTFGTLVGVALYLMLPEVAWSTYLAIVLLAAVAGIWLCGMTSRDLKVDDHPGIVWDEIVGYLLTMAAAPPGWLWVILGFVLFRLFDFAKPWPIRAIDQHVHGGAGIMLDDLAAGVYAFLCMQALAQVADFL